MLKANWTAGQLGHLATHNTLATRLNDFPNARDFGTNGAAIQAAIDAATAAGRGCVYIPAGTWTVAATIQCAPGVDLHFDRGAVIFATGDVDLIRVVPGIEIRGGFFRTEQISAFRFNM